jgi:YD repeat-containing protein
MVSSGPKLKKIESKNFEITFNSSELFQIIPNLSNINQIIPDYQSVRLLDTTRNDLKNVVSFGPIIITADIQNPSILKNILIKDKTSGSKKGVVLDHDYFVTKGNINDLPLPLIKSETYYWGGLPTPAIVYYNDFISDTLDFKDLKRLRLRGVYEVQIENTNSKLLPGYTLEYDAHELPRRLSQARDHWGFYNGQHDNRNKSGLVPISFDQVLTCSNISNREANPIFGKAGLLTRLFYPTGFQVSFNYESHEAVNWGLTSTIGGFRIESIESKDCLTNQAKTILYEYKDLNNLSSGFVSLKPKYLFKHNTTLGANSINYKIQSSGIYGFMLGNFINGGFISYKRVVEREVGNGYSEYIFFADELNSLISNNAAIILDEIPTFDFKRGALKSISYYNENSNILKTNEYYYTPDNQVIKSKIKAGFLTPIDAISGRLKYNIGIRLSISANGIVPSINANFSTEQIKFVKYNYDIPIGRFNLEKTIEKTFDQVGQNPVITQTERFYESTKHNLVTRIKTTFATGEIKEKFNRYAKDFNYTGLTPVVSATYSIDGNSIIGLQEKFMNPLIEQYVKRNGKVIEGKVYQYSENIATKGLLKKEFDLETDIPLTDYIPAIHEKIQIVYSGAIVNSFKPDYRYTEKKEYLSYNAKGMPLEIKQSNGAITKFGYSNSGLVISNVTIASNSIDSANVKYENNLLFGLTKKTQSNATFDTFSYDGAGRLKEVRDIDNNISKSNLYNYATIQCIPNPIIVSGDFQVCTDNNAILTASGCNGIVKWYNSSSTLLNTGTSITITNLSNNQTFSVSCTIGSIESNKSKFSLKTGTNIAPQAPSIIATNTYGDYNSTVAIPTSNTITLVSGGAICSGNITWSGGTISNQTGITKVLTPSADAIYYAKCVNNNCQSNNSNPVQIRICNDSNEPNNSSTEATNIPVANLVSCIVSLDIDYYKIVVNGAIYYIKVRGYYGESCGIYQLKISNTATQLIIETAQDINSIGGFDTILTLYDNSGSTVLAHNDDYGGTIFSKIIYNL